MKQALRRALSSLLLLALVSCSLLDGRPERIDVYVGTYSGGTSEGIYRLDLDPKSGALSGLRVAAKTKNPSFLAIHPNGRNLYAVGEHTDLDFKKSGAIVAYAIDPATGKLSELNSAPSGGAGPCHLVVDRSGRSVLAANYGGGSVCALRIRDDGSLGAMSAFVQHHGSSAEKSRQSEPHAHSINVDPENRFACAADLGVDKVLVYRFDSEQGTLAANDPPAAEVTPGSGPRHFAFHPSGRFAYVINELASTVTAFTWDALAGKLAEIQTISTLPAGPVAGNSTAEVSVHRSGRFLYGSNRGHDSIAVFRIDQESGRLTHVENEPTGGKTPRNFAIDPTGTFLLAANQATENIVVFRIDEDSGALESTGHQLEVPKPVCVRFVAR